MITIEKYPQQFALGNETVELHPNMLRKIKNQREEKCSFEGKIIAYAFEEKLEEYVIILKYPDGYHCFSRKYGWFGPYHHIDAVEFDAEKQMAYLKAGMPLTR